MNEMETAARIIEIVPFLSRTISAEARQTLGDGWFTLVHLRVLAHVRRTGGCSLGELAEQRGVSLPTMSKMVSSLVDKGLITREPDPNNRRAVVIRLTTVGDQLYLKVLTKLQERVAQDIAHFTTAHRDGLVSCLEMLAEAMAVTGEVRQHLELPSSPDEKARTEAEIASNST